MNEMIQLSLMVITFWLTFMLMIWLRSTIDGPNDRRYEALQKLAQELDEENRDFESNQGDRNGR